jgi:hypothetical protein
VALRARMAWAFGQLAPPEGVVADLVPSAVGRSWVARLTAPARGAGYQVRAEAEEGLPVQAFPTHAADADPRVGGPEVLVALVQEDVRTSAGFDWAYLASMWPLMVATRTDWLQTPRPRAPHDRAARAAMIAAGGSPALGAGYGEAQAARHGGCMLRPKAPNAAAA